MIGKKILIVGFGSVGRSLARLLASKKQWIEKKYSLSLRVTGLIDSSGGVFNEHGFEPIELLRMVEVPRSSLGKMRYNSIPNVSMEEAYEKANPDIHVELSPSIYVREDPCYKNIMWALDNGVSVVSSCKPPFVFHHKELMRKAYIKGLNVLYRATVMGGTPLIPLLYSLKSREFVRIRGILNSTTNYILSTMHEEFMDWGKAVERAVKLGVSEKDIESDVNGLDAAAKLAIISNVIEAQVPLEKISREDARQINLKKIASALRSGRVYKQVAYLDVEKREGRIVLESLDPEDPLFRINGLYNGVEVQTAWNTLFVKGIGAGGIVTAHAVLDDILCVNGG